MGSDSSCVFIAFGYNNPLYGLQTVKSSCPPLPAVSGSTRVGQSQVSPWNSTGLEVLRDADFQGDRLDRPGTFVVCFGAAWCPITRRFMPKFTAEREKIRGTLAIADITDTDDPLWDTFRIRITPSILVFQDGKLKTRIDGKRFIGITSSGLARLEEALPPARPG